MTPLIDKLMAVKHETEAVDEIMEFFSKNGVPIDESRKRNLVTSIFLRNLISILFNYQIILRGVKVPESAI